MEAFGVISASIVCILSLTIWWKPWIALAFPLVAGPIVTAGLGMLIGQEASSSIFHFSVCVAGILILRVRHKVPIWPFSWQEWGIFAFCGMMVLSLAYTSAPEYGLQKTLLLVAMAPPVVVLARMCAMDRARLEKTLKALAVVGFITICYLLAAYASQRTFFVVRFGEGASIKLSMGASVAACALLFILIRGGNIVYWSIAIVGIPIAFIVMVVTGSRGPFYGLFAASAASMIHWRTLGRGLVIITIVTLGLIAAATFLAPAQLRERLTNVQWRGTAREQFAIQAASLYAQHPLQGVGAGGFAARTINRDRRHYPHNLWLEAAAETGTVGIGGLLLALGVSIPVLLAVRRSTADLPGTAMTVQLLFWTALLHSMLTADAPLHREWYAVMGLMGGIGCWRDQFRQAAQTRRHDEVLHDQPPTRGLSHAQADW